MELLVNFKGNNEPVQVASVQTLYEGCIKSISILP